MLGPFLACRLQAQKLFDNANMLIAERREMAPKLGVQWPANTTSIHPVSHARLTQTAEALDWLWLNTRTDYGFCPLSFGQHSEGIDSQPLCKRVKTIANNNFKRTYGICCTEIDYLLFNTTDFHCHV